ncbi:MAG: methyltransferase domain-containing protein [Candidatus Aminicenantes bacterium]|nr:methyltransferase domain-containing protein [Candidatus Aminicenantes bacterium]
MNTETRNRWIKIAFDASILAFSYGAAVIIAFQGIPGFQVRRSLLLLGAGLVAARLLCFSVFRVFPVTWKFFSTDDAVRVSAAVLPPAVLLVLGKILLPAARPLRDLPWSAVFLEFLLVLTVSLGVRLADRLAHERHGRPAVRKKLLLIGAGTCGSRFIRDLKRAVNPEYAVVGFVDDDPGKAFRRIEGVRVLGDVSRIPQIAGWLKFDEAVLMIGNPAPEALRRIIEAFRGTGARLTHFRNRYELLYDESWFAAGSLPDFESAARGQAALFKELTGRDYQAEAESAYPVDHPFERNKPFSEPQNDSGDYIMAAGAMIKLLRLWPGAEVLDLGCGCGWTTIFLARCGFAAVGVDVNEASLDIGRENAAKAGVRAEFVRADSQTFASERRFDAVVIFDSLHHCLREDEVLSRAFAVLRPGGKIVLSEQYHPDDDGAGLLTHAAAVEAMRTQGTLEKGLGKRYLVRLLYACGFERAVLLSTPGLHGTWITARKPRKDRAPENGLLRADDFDRAMWPYD